MSVVSISVSDDLLEEIDGFVEDHGYSGRSELLREAARSLMGEFDDSELEGREIVSTVTVIFEFHGEHDVESKMIEMRHDHEDKVKSNVHSHIGDDYCMELFVLEGTLDDVREFVGALRPTDGVLSVNYSVNPIDDLT